MPTADTHRDCGGQGFTARTTAEIEQSFVILDGGQWLETRSEVLDTSDRLGEQDTFTCVECGEDITADDLVTQEEYNTADDDEEPEHACPGCGGYVFTEIGHLGSAYWVRCRACGLDSRYPEREELSA